MYEIRERCTGVGEEKDISGGGGNGCEGRTASQRERNYKKLNARKECQTKETNHKGMRGKGKVNPVRNADEGIK